MLVTSCSLLSSVGSIWEKVTLELTTTVPLQKLGRRQSVRRVRTVDAQPSDILLEDAKEVTREFSVSVVSVGTDSENGSCHFSPAEIIFDWA